MTLSSNHIAGMLTPPVVAMVIACVVVTLLQEAVHGVFVIIVFSETVSNVVGTKLCPPGVAVGGAKLRIAQLVVRVQEGFTVRTGDGADGGLDPRAGGWRGRGRKRRRRLGANGVLW